MSSQWNPIPFRKRKPKATRRPRTAARIIPAAVVAVHGETVLRLAVANVQRQAA